MIRHHCVILWDFLNNAFPSYTSISNAAVGSTIYNSDVSHRFHGSSHTIVEILKK